MYVHPVSTEVEKVDEVTDILCRVLEKNTKRRSREVFETQENRERG